MWLLDLATGAKRRCCLPPGEAPASRLRRSVVEARRLGLVLRQRSRRRVPRADVLLASPTAQADGVTPQHSWDIDQTSASTRAAAAARRRAPTSRAGDELRFFDADTFDAAARRRSCRTAASPMLARSIRACRCWHRRSTSSAAPGTIVGVDPANGAVQRWTHAVRAAGRRRLAAFAEQSIVRWKSFDGREISGLLSAAAGALRRASGRC